MVRDSSHPCWRSEKREFHATFPSMKKPTSCMVIDALSDLERLRPAWRDLLARRTLRERARVLAAEGIAFARSARVALDTLSRQS
jgi:hypothetical protein